MDKIVELVSKATLWLSSPANRLRLRGTRIEVIAAVVCREPEPSILLGKSPYHSIWMPPQEGVNMKESFKDALVRCLEVECGLDLPDEDRALDRALYLRSIRYVGAVELPTERHGERLIADDALGTQLESVTMTQKAYWMATVILKSRNDIDPKADGREFLGFEWYSLEEARKIICATNHAKKAELLEECINMCARDLRGVPVRTN